MPAVESDAKDDGKVRRKANNFTRANPISKLFFCWMLPTFVRGVKRELSIEDLSHPTKVNLSKSLGDKLERKWFEEQCSAKSLKRVPSLRRALVRTFFWDYQLHAVLLMVAILILRSLQPVALKILLQFFEKDSNMTLTDAYVAASLLVILTLATSLMMRHGMRLGFEFGMRIRIACSSLIYRKVLRMDLGAIHHTAAGKVVNLLSNDVGRFDLAFVVMPFLCIVPLHVILVLCLMYKDIGWYAFIAMGAMVLQTIPLQGYLSKMTAKYRLAVAKKTDERVKLMSEIVSGIKVIKMYAWEKPFEAVVAEKRKREMDCIRKTSYAWIAYCSFSVFAERTSLYITLLIYSLSGQAVNSALVFSFTSFLYIIKISIALWLPLAISRLSESLVAIKRIQDFLLMYERNDLEYPSRYSKSEKNTETDTGLEEKQKGDALDLRLNNVMKSNHQTELFQKEVAVELFHVIAQWTSNSSSLTLSDITMRIRQGDLCAVVGAVGSGKSSVLQLILGELSASSGRAEVNGTISYASQEPWLFVGTIRENILFGSLYDANKYKEVVKVCALEPDFRQIPRGDMALVGERGISLSGGQRARICLARAVYRKADIYLLDDPLSAVDAAVGRQLFENCINGYLKGSTRLLVTHQLHYLKSADLVIILNNGKIEAMGTFEELASLGENFAKLLTPISDDKEEAAVNSLRRRNDKKSNTTQDSNETSDTKSDEAVPEALADEVRVVGSQRSSLYWMYIRAGNSWMYFAFVILMLLFGQCVASACELWVTFWTNNTFLYGFNSTLSRANIEMPDTGNNASNLDTKIGPLSTKEYLIVYTGLAIGCVLMVIMRGYLFFRMCIKSSQGLHNQMFHAVLRGVPNFFDKHPSGRILNRFSKDVGQMDEALPNTMMDAIQIYLMQIASIVLVAVSLPWMLVTALLLCLVLYLMFKLYLRTGQAVKRIEGVTKSPVFSHLSGTIDGMTTIRCYNAQDKCIKEFDDFQDIHTSTWTQYINGNVSLGWWLDFICSVYILIVVFAFLLIDTKIPPGYVGLAISQALTLSGILQFGITQTIEVIAQMTNVERVVQYTKIETEKNLDKGDQEKPSGWPHNGAINFSGTSLRYAADKPPVLNNLKIDVHPGWKVGIVGRTGAGKTSLIAALFRLAEIEGEINIDGIETGSISLQDLRSSISVIPQEPVLFSATVRYNLDPFNLYEDATLWQALEAVELKGTVQSLDFMITQGGSNFSVGQRQLLCVARAIIKNNKILVLDEATANVDPQTDSLIQRTIRKRFFNYSVLTIAHRLNTIMDSDRVLVMNFGKVVEFDHPYKLLLNKKGYFNSMVSETGPLTARQLFSVAKETYEIHNKNSIDLESDDASSLLNVSEQNLEIRSTEENEKVKGTDLNVTEKKFDTNEGIKRNEELKRTDENEKNKRNEENEEITSNKKLKKVISIESNNYLDADRIHNNTSEAVKSNDNIIFDKYSKVNNINKYNDFKSGNNMKEESTRSEIEVLKRFEEYEKTKRTKENDRDSEKIDKSNEIYEVSRL